MNRVRKLSLFLVVVLMIQFCINPVVTYAHESTPKRLTLSMFSSYAPQMTEIKGFYDDSTFFISLNTLNQISGVTIESVAETTAILSSNGGSRTYTIEFETGSLTENGCNTHIFTIPTLIVDDELCVSALHFLRYIGADVQIKEEGTQFVVVFRYNIFDALSDCAKTNIGNFFNWTEVDTGDEDLEDKLLNAGVVALVNNDSNIFRMIFDADGISRETIEDALISILQCEGQNSGIGSSELESLEALSAFYAVEKDVLEFIIDAYEEEIPESYIKKADDLVGASSFTAASGVKILKALETIKQYENITDAQNTLLKNTLIKYEEDSSLLCGEWDLVYDAALNVSIKAESSTANTSLEMSKVLGETLYDIMEEALEDSLEIEQGIEPVTFAWESAIAAVKLIPYTSDMIDKKTMLYNSYNCWIVQCIANEICINADSELYHQNLCVDDLDKQGHLLQQIKDSLTLQYKATIATRESLINSDFLSASYSEEMKAMNRETAILLNKLENCIIVEIGKMPLVEDDISWMDKVDSNANDDSTDSKDTDDTYIEISTWQDLKAIESNPSGKYVLTCDIDLSICGFWTPICVDKPFTGTLNGNGYSIKNIMVDISRTDDIDEAGLFGWVSGATFVDLGMVGGTVNINSDAYGGGAGTLAALSTVRDEGRTQIMTTVNRCYVSTEVTSTVVENGTSSYHATMAIGSFFGVGCANFTDCYSVGNVKGSRNYADQIVGGFIGNLYIENDAKMTITNCYSLGNVSGLHIKGGKAGAFVGYPRYSEYVEKFDIINSYYSQVQNAMTGVDDTTFTSVCSLSLEEMTVGTSYVGFNFNEIWAISETINKGLPYLQTQQTNKSDYEESETSLDDFVGTWTIDADFTMKKSGVSMISMFGKDYSKFGCGMNIEENGDFDYYIASGIGGKGNYVLSDNVIIATLTSYEDNCEMQIMLTPVIIDGVVYLKTVEYEYDLYWRKN